MSRNASPLGRVAPRMPGRDPPERRHANGRVGCSRIYGAHRLRVLPDQAVGGGRRGGRRRRAGMEGCQCGPSLVPTPPPPRARGSLGDDAMCRRQEDTDLERGAPQGAVLCMLPWSLPLRGATAQGRRTLQLQRGDQRRRLVVDAHAPRRAERAPAVHLGTAGGGGGRGRGERARRDRAHTCRQARSRGVRRGADQCGGGRGFGRRGRMDSAHARRAARAREVRRGPHRRGVGRGRGSRGRVVYPTHDGSTERVRVLRPSAARGEGRRRRDEGGRRLLRPDVRVRERTPPVRPLAHVVHGVPPFRDAP